MSRCLLTQKRMLGETTGPLPSPPPPPSPLPLPPLLLLPPTRSPAHCSSPVRLLLFLTLTLEITARGGARAFHLEVRAGNAAARALYRAMGFEEVGKRHSYYSAPVEDAVLLSRVDPAAAVARES